MCADVLNDKNKGTEVYQKLQIFFDGMKDRSEAHSSFVSVYEQTEKSFDDIIQRALGVAVPIYEQTSSMVREMEQDLIACYSRNHHQREKLVQSLELYDNKWQDTFNSLMRRVIDKSMVAVSDDMSQMDNAIDETNTKVNLSDDTNSKVTENKASAQIDSTCVANTEDNDDADGDEPDWDMLVQFEPSRESIQIFLDYRDRWNVACGNFSIALDEIHDQFKSSTSEILRTVGTVYDRIMNEELEERQRDIQYNLTNNYRRRKFLETALDEAARQQQGIFMKLMARVSGALMPSGDKRPRSGTCTERHSI